MIIATNKKAFHDYTIEETYEAGIALRGDEVKSVRAKQVVIGDAFATVHNGELVLINCHITAYSHAYSKEDKSRQTRKLLLNRKEIVRIIGAISRKGLTVIPLKMYINDRGYVKVELGLAKHKKAIDKKATLRERDIKRETLREAKVTYR